MEAEIARLKAESAAKDENMTQLRVKAKAFAEALTNEKKQVEAQLAQSKNELSELKIKAKAFADNVKAQILVEKERVHTLEGQLQTKESEISTLKANGANGANMLNDTASHQVIAQEMENLKSQHAIERQRDLTQIAELEQSQLNGANTWSNERSLLDQQIQQLMLTNQQLKESKEQNEINLQNDITTLRQELNNASSQNQMAQGQIHERERMIVEALQAISKSSSSDALQLVAKIRDELDTQRSQIANLERQVTSVEAEKSQARTNSASLADALRNQIGALETERNQLQWKLSEVQASQASVESECSSLRSQLSQSQSIQANASTAYEADCASLKSQLNQEKESHEAACTALRAELQQINEKNSQAVNELQMELAHSKSNHQSQTSGLEAKALALEQARQDWLAKELAWTKERADITSKHEKYIHDEEEKKSKVKAYVQALTTEKQKAMEDVDKQLKERDAIHEKRLADIKTKTMSKFAEHESVIKKQQEELEGMRQQMTAGIQKYEAEIKLLQTKKKEAEDETMEVLKKKRLAAKAETQKLANDLEGIQKRAAILVDATGNKCTHQSKQLEVLQERVMEAIHVVSHNKKCDISNLNELAQIITSPRMSTANLPGPGMGLSKIDEDVSHVFDQMTALTNVTERLVDLAMEDGDLSLKEIVVDRMKKQFSTCFVHHYTKADEAGLLRQRSSSTTPESPTRNMLQDPHCLGCNHNFCKPCIDIQLRKTVSICPKCHIPMYPTDVHRNQFLDGLLQEWKLVEAAIALASPRKNSIPCDAVKSMNQTQKVKRKLPLDSVASPSQDDSLSTLIATPQLENYQKRLQNLVADLDGTMLSSSTATQSPILETKTSLLASEKKSETIPLEESSTQTEDLDITMLSTATSTPSPPHHETTSYPPPSERNLSRMNSSTSQQETFMSDPPSQLKNPSTSSLTTQITPQVSYAPREVPPTVIVPQSPQKLAVPMIHVPFVVPSTQISSLADEDIDEDEEIPETELQSYNYDDDNETQAPMLQFDTTQASPSLDINSPSVRVEPTWTKAPTQTSPREIREHAKVPAPSASHEIRLVATKISKAQRLLVLQCVRRLGGRFGLSFDDAIDSATGEKFPRVSHVITTSNAAKRCPRTAKYMEGLLKQCWIVDVQWIVDCLKAMAWISEEKYEILGDEYCSQVINIPQKCRLTSRADFTQIFHSIIVQPMHDTIDQLESIARIVRTGGGYWIDTNDSKGIEDTDRQRIGIVSKTLSISKCKELIRQNISMNIVRITWIFDCVSRMERLPYDRYIP